MTPDLTSLLVGYLAAQHGKSYRPGRHDCALFAAGWVELASGRDPAAKWRGAYRALDGGHDLLHAEGHAGLGDLAASLLDEVAVWQARTGDIALIDEGGAESFGLVGVPHIHVLKAEGGLDAVPLERAVRVFRP